MFRVLRVGDDVSSKRHSVIQELSKLLRLLKIDATLVFDSHYFPGEVERHHVRDLEVIFTDEGESADQLILELLNERPDPMKETVVTSDKQLAAMARRRAAKTETVENFFALLQRRYKNKIKQLKEPQVIKKKTITPPRKVIKGPVIPPPNISVDEAFQFYLEVFETSFQQICPPPKHLEEKKKKEQAKLTDYERWMQAFSRILEE